MNVDKSTHPSVYLLRIVLGLGILFALCSLCAALGAFYTYGGISQWWLTISEGVRHEGVLYLNGAGFEVAFFGSVLMSILGLCAFVFTFIAYQRRKIEKKSIVWAMLLFGIAILILMGSIMSSKTLCTADAGKYGNSDNVTCTIPLHP